MTTAQHVIVFDVNGVLCRKVFDNTYSLKSRADAYTPSGLALFVRPGVEALLKQLACDGWRIIFWSSAMRQTLDAIRAALFPFVSPLTVMSHENSPDDERHPVIRAGKNWSILKDLRLLWRVPSLRCGPTNTVIVDDSWSKVRLQAANALIVPSFQVDVRNGTVDAAQAERELAIVNRIGMLLSRMRDARDVRQVLAEHAGTDQFIKLGNFTHADAPSFKRIAAISPDREKSHVQVRASTDDAEEEQAAAGS